MKRILTVIIILLAISAQAQTTKYKPEEVKEFYRQAKLSTEYIELQKSVDTNNAQDKLIPQEIKFIIEQRGKSGPDNEKVSNLLKGFVYINTELGVTKTAYVMTYDRKLKKIISIQKSGEVNPTRHSSMK